jgi:hypothetical protein
VGTSPVTAALAISTTKAHVVSGPTSASAHTGALLWLSSGSVLAGVFVFGIPATGRRRYQLACGLLVLGLVGAAVGCSGGGGSSTPKDAGTPAGTYVVGVTATGTTSHTTSVTVVVQ